MQITVICTPFFFTLCLFPSPPRIFGSSVLTSLFSFSPPIPTDSLGRSSRCVCRMIKGCGKTKGISSAESKVLPRSCCLLLLFRIIPRSPFFVFVLQHIESLVLILFTLLNLGDFASQRHYWIWFKVLY